MQNSGLILQFCNHWYITVIFDVILIFPVWNKRVIKILFIFVWNAFAAFYNMLYAGVLSISQTNPDFFMWIGTNLNNFNYIIHQLIN